ncbi:cryptochrome/photolyase family protein [Aquihabitans sp. McL0605]|uniref:cryptochrome/photolyase family protein n=1 Tax=Aquihabitans sp. McL0605 TaxID=3415671 RepID=UPI003CF6DA77
MAITPGSIGIVWFRRDLRLADNPALRVAARAHDLVVPVFVHDSVLAAHAGANRTAYLHATLDALDADLGGLLVERAGDPAAVVASLAAEVEAPTVYVAEDFGPYGRRRDDEVEVRLLADGRALRRVGSPYAVAPGSVFTKSGSPFKVFTPFARAWREHGWILPLESVPTASFVGGLAGGGRPPTPEPEARGPMPPAGERAAHDAADAFLDGLVGGYRDGRDRPDHDRTSRLSPHLKFGTVHPRQLLARLSDEPGPSTFATELAWREFYADVLYHSPETVRRNVNASLGGLVWDTGSLADDRFDAWCQGRTGYPIVDAGMRQLLDEGWMHNRVRMIAASFLVKDLHLDWRRGAAWFLRHLYDGDLASNTHGWQWTAGTGTDAAPFFRVFNPTTQGLRFDPDGDYVRRYVPELRAMEGSAVHEPWKLAGDLFGAPADGYPPPIVDHAAERAETLARYQQR